jgi:predicted dehydrogenase
VQHIIGSWRESGSGALEDLGSHLLDLTGDLLGARGRQFQAWSLESHEAQTYDHAVFASSDGTIVLEVSYLSWKNGFGIDLYGSQGSIHMTGLQKWGDSKLFVRRRVLPSGVPHETCECVPAGQDVTWERDIEHFERLVASNAPTSLENDWWISNTLRKVATG